MEIRNSELQIKPPEAAGNQHDEIRFWPTSATKFVLPNGIIGFSGLMARTQNQRTSGRLSPTPFKSSPTLKFRDILDLSKIDAGKLTIDNIDMNLPSTLEEVLTTRPMASAKTLNSIILFISVLLIRCDPAP